MEDDAGGHPLVEARPRDDLEARRIRGAVAARLFGEREQLAIGRFVVVARLGEGGFGAVYACYDPKLDRRVAVKVIETREADLQERALAEARAAARINHPHVVAIHEADRAGDLVYLAMELVEGDTLSAWRAAAPRSWREVIAIAAQAARGVAAAHRAGLVHRDLKPDNVLVGRDEAGQPIAKVADFGLATALDGGGARGSGTPAYMAPEQRAGGAIGPATDQYSLCFTIWEALTGARPEPGDDGELALDPGAAMPGWVAAALRRGLRRDPAARHPSMDALVAALTADPARRRRRLLGAAGLVIAGAGFTAATLVLTSATDRDACAAAAGDLAATWPARRDAVADAIGRAPAYGAASAATVVGALDGWASGWSTRRIAACRDHERGVASAEALDLRQRCLDRQRAEVGALIDALAGSDATAAESAVDAVATLPAPEACDDLDALRRRVAPPDDPAERAEVEAIEERAAKARSAALLGRTDEAAGHLSGLIERAGAAAHPVPLAAAHIAAALVAERRGDVAGVVSHYEEALAAALAGRDDRVAAEVAVALVSATGYLQRDPEAATRWERIAGALVASLGTAPVLTARLRNMIGVNRRLGRDPAAAEAELRAALALLEEHAPDHADVASVLLNLGAVLYDLERYQEGEAILTRALDLQIAAYGERHPNVAKALNNRSAVRQRAGRLAAALADAERALAIKEEVDGPDHPSLASTLTNVGSALGDLGRVAESIPYLERAVAIIERAHGPTYPRLISARINLALAHLELDAAGPARAAALGALEVIEATEGAGSYDHAYTLALLARAEIAAGDVASATEALRRAEASPARSELVPLDAAQLDLAAMRIAAHRGRHAEARRRAEAAIAGLMTDPAWVKSAEQVKAWMTTLPDR